MHANIRLDINLFKLSTKTHRDADTTVVTQAFSHGW